MQFGDFPFPSKDQFAAWNVLCGVNSNFLTLPLAEQYHMISYDESKNNPKKKNEVTGSLLYIRNMVTTNKFHMLFQSWSSENVCLLYILCTLLLSKMPSGNKYSVLHHPADPSSFMPSQFTVEGNYRSFLFCSF